MTRPYTENDFSDILDSDLIWRRRELSDMKAALRTADTTARAALLRAIITMGYAHWEGFVRTCAARYFEHLTLRKLPFASFERQIYVNSILTRLDSLRQTRSPLSERCKLVNDILDGQSGRFSFVKPELVDTRSNLSTDVIKDICIVCGVDWGHFESQRTFLDVMVLKRRNEIAHGQQVYIEANEIDEYIGSLLALMEAFRNLLENKIYTKAYVA
ncbi:MAG: hypothetical protein J0M12_17225 [Deltaproteobacteria bacterium]|nr:hypothetical protein [Deltaproteobacteria bacterium]